MKSTKEELALLGISETKDFMFTAPDGCEHDSLESAVWVGVFGFCSCGNPEYDMRRILRIMQILIDRSLEGFAELCDEHNCNQIYLYWLDKEDFTEHGSSIYGSWLTDKGKALYSALWDILETE